MRMKPLDLNMTLSLTPGFSRVVGGHVISKPFQRFGRCGGETVETDFHDYHDKSTRLKPGVNESGVEETSTRVRFAD